MFPKSRLGVLLCGIPISAVLDAENILQFNNMIVSRTPVGCDVHVIRPPHHFCTEGIYWSDDTKESIFDDLQDFFKSVKASQVSAAILYSLVVIYMSRGISFSSKRSRSESFEETPKIYPDTCSLLPSANF